MLRAAVLAFAFAALISPASASENFTSIEVSGNLRVEIVEGEQNAFEISGPDAGRIRTRVRDGELQLAPASRPWFGPERRLDAVVRVSVVRLESLSAARGALVRADSIAANDLEINAAMGARVEVTGECGRLSANAAMGGVVQASGLACQGVDANAAMGGSIRVNARQILDASAAMGGSIDVLGAPARRETSAVMGGSIRLN